MKVSWKDHRTKDEIHGIRQHERSIVGMIGNRLKNWIGYVLRGRTSFVKIVVKSRIVDKKMTGS